jgi:hypothetical protein
MPWPAAPASLCRCRRAPYDNDIAGAISTRNENVLTRILYPEFVRPTYGVLYTMPALASASVRPPAPGALRFDSEGSPRSAPRGRQPTLTNDSHSTVRIPQCD